MKKTLIALAALAATASFAQSSVTIYGILDMGYQSSKANVGTTTYKQTAVANGVQSGGRIGFKGTEDLGGGLKANFTVENGITPDESTTAFGTSNRQSFVSLEGGFGTVAVGRQYTLHHSNQGAGDVVGNITHAGYVGGLDSLVRASNAISYTSPSFSGFTVAGMVGLGETITTAAAPTKKSELSAVRVSYANGPLAAGYVNETLKKGTLADIKVLDGVALDTGDLGTLFDKRTANSLFATYDFGVAKVGFVNNDSKYDDVKWKANTLSAAVPMGAATLLASTGSGKFTTDGGSSKLNAYQVGVSYALSKRTNVYAFNGQTKYKDEDAKLTQTTIGVRHSF